MRGQVDSTGEGAKHLKICEGLAYLHRSDIVHGDLKGLNVLVSNDGTPMLADFGNAILRDRTLLFTATTMKTSFSPRWAVRAPEVLVGSSSYSMEADIYALGMAMTQIVETVTGKMLYSEKNDIAVMFSVVVKQKLPARSEDAIPSDSKHGDGLWALLVSCWLPQPEERPRAGKVAGISRSTAGPVPQPRFGERLSYIEPILLPEIGQYLKRD
ncbi:hypothetical protein FRC10_004780 [Ceratobasidium sp. 414]|nr:hypothetical protein FRC10_004780 [Ceratobasidium sp. 414]